MIAVFERRGLAYVQDFCQETVVILKYSIMNRAAVIKLDLKYYYTVTFISFRLHAYMDILQSIVFYRMHSYHEGRCTFCGIQNIIL